MAHRGPAVVVARKAAGWLSTSICKVKKIIACRDTPTQPSHSSFPLLLIYPRRRILSVTSRTGCDPFVLMRERCTMNSFTMPGKNLVAQRLPRKWFRPSRRGVKRSSMPVERLEDRLLLTASLPGIAQLPEYAWGPVEPQLPQDAEPARWRGVESPAYVG